MSSLEELQTLIHEKFGIEPADLAGQQAAPGELVDADGEVQRHRLLRAGGVGGARGEVGHDAGLEEELARAALAVDLPQLGAVRLEHEDVVGVGVHGEALCAGRGEVGVGLARVPQLELELGHQVGDGGIDPAWSARVRMPLTNAPIRSPSPQEATTDSTARRAARSEIRWADSYPVTISTTR